MAKELPTVEYFNILIIGVQPSALGETMAQLAKLGHTNVRPELVTEVTRFKQKVVHGIKAEDYLMEWVSADHPTFAIKDAVAHFRANDRTDGACYTAARVLVDRKVLRKLSPGHYGLAGIKSLAAPKKKTSASKKKHGLSHIDFILKKAKGNIINRTTAKEWLEKDGRNSTSISSVFRDLLKQGRVKRVNEGEYKIIQKTNGAAPAVTETANG